MALNSAATITRKASKVSVISSQGNFSGSSASFQGASNQTQDATSYLSTDSHYRALPADAPAPRLCTLVLRPNEEAFGLAIHASDILFGGHFIAMISGDGAAQRSGVKIIDRIIEVNGIDVTNENFVQVAERIELGKKERKVRLLVADEYTDEYFTNNNMVITSRAPNVIDCDSLGEKEEQNRKGGLFRRQFSSTLAGRSRYTGPPTIFKEARERLIRNLRKERRSMSRISVMNRQGRLPRAENNNADSLSFDEYAFRDFQMLRQESVSTISTVNDQQSVSNFDVYSTLSVPRRSRFDDPSNSMLEELDENAELESIVPGAKELQSVENYEQRQTSSKTADADGSESDQTRNSVVLEKEQEVTRRLKEQKSKDDKSGRRRFRMFTRFSEKKGSSTSSDS